MRSRSPAESVAEEVGERERRAQLGLAAAALGRVAEALSTPAGSAHPVDDGRVGDAPALDHDVDLAADAGRPLQRLEVAHARPGPAARAARGRTRPRSGCRAPSRRRRARARRPARAPGRRSGAAHAAPPARPAGPGAAGDAQRPRARPRRARQRRAAGAPSRAVRAARSAGAAAPAVSASARASAMPATSSRPKPRTIGTGESAARGTRRRSRRGGGDRRRPRRRAARSRRRPPPGRAPGAGSRSRRRGR